jgi:hypothetical protein
MLFSDLPFYREPAGRIKEQEGAGFNRVPADAMLLPTAPARPGSAETKLARTGKDNP